MEKVCFQGPFELFKGAYHEISGDNIPMGHFVLLMVTLYKKTRHKSQFAIWHNAHKIIKVKSVFSF